MYEKPDHEFRSSGQEFERPERESYRDTSSNENLDIVIGFILFGVGWCINGVPGVLLGLGIAGYFLITLMANSSSGGSSYERPSRSRPSGSSPIQSTLNAPVTDEPTIADKVEAIHKQNDFKCPACGATVLPTDMRCRHCGSVLVAAVDLPRPATWSEVQVGQPVQVRHPESGPLNLSVAHRLVYGELWQAQMRPSVPWTLTGNYYVGLGLVNGMLLLNWQGRFYLLESSSPLTDREINQTFARPAREFAASNQSKDVNFAYNRVVWRVDDIGRFRVEWVEGEGAKADAGALGRFIHAKSERQILVVEDYQSRGADTLWMGYQIQESDIHF